MNHHHRLAFLTGCLVVGLGLSAQAQAPPEESAPPATGDGEVANLLRQWYHQGTAAGNVGDYYDNRDGGHSRLRLNRHPQLRQVEYSEQEKEQRRHWGLQVGKGSEHITFGNSSTASGDIDWGSNAKRAMMADRWIQALYQQYIHNDLYIYPEHRDHDPGHNGRGGYGDLFPANTPYVIISQGSSGSDRPFMRAVAYTLAAFQPETKKALADAGLLMPTIQMIFRSSNQQVAAPEDYLTGKAHPTVFESKDLDIARMVRAAHAIDPHCLPPMVKLTVLEENPLTQGLDYFDAGRSEKLFDTPCAIARIGRSVHLHRRMVISAEDSFDPKGRPLTYHWAVLRGDESRIGIQPIRLDGSRVEIVIGYHPRRPIQPGSEMESNRVDIGAFVHNGQYYSAPAFVSVSWMDDEARTYDEAGRIVELAYGVGDSTIGYPKGSFAVRDEKYDITDWAGLLETAADPTGGLPSELLRQQLGDIATRLVQDARRALATALEEAETRRTAYEAAKAEADADEGRLKRLQARLRDAEQDAARILTEEQPRLADGVSLKQRLEDALNEMRRDVDFYVRHGAELDALLEAGGDEERVKAFRETRKGLLDEGLLVATEDDGYRLSQGRQGDAPAADRLTAYERNRLEWLNVAVLEQILYPGLVNRPFRRNYINPYLATPKDWRDVYHYDPAGKLTGWTRYRKGEKTAFTALGTIVLARDEMGRPLRSQSVGYGIEARKQKPQRLKWAEGNRTIHHGYRGPDDRVGYVVRVEGESP